MASLGGGGGDRGRRGAGGCGGAPATTMMNRRLKFPPGFRFIPTDVELVVHYLRLKKAGLPLAYDIITEVDIKDHHPEELIETYRSMGEHRWYFFTKRQKKYLNGSRPSRSAKNGFWKATGADQKIKDREVTVGTKRSLVFYDGTPRDGIKTDWIMYEYRIDDASKKKMPDRNTMTLDDWVLCTIQKKRGAEKSTPNQMREVVEAGDTANEDGGCDGAENAEKNAAGIQEPDGGRDEGKSAKRGAEEDEESSELKRQKREEDNGATLELPPAETTEIYRELYSADCDGLPNIQFSELEGVDDELLMEGPILDPDDWIWEYVPQDENLFQCNLEKKQTETSQEEKGRNLDFSQTKGNGGGGEEDFNGCQKFPPGYRFEPSDEELINVYLRRRREGLPLPYDAITTVNLAEYEPGALVEKYKHKGERRWYFFTSRERKYKMGLRPCRAGNGGYWKATGGEMIIESNGEVIGYKRALVFYGGRPKNSINTDWIMHEYRIKVDKQLYQPSGSMRLDDHVICCIQKKRRRVDKSERSTSDDDGSNEQMKIDQVSSEVSSEGDSKHFDQSSEDADRSFSLINEEDLRDFVCDLEAKNNEENLPDPLAQANAGESFAALASQDIAVETLGGLDDYFPSFCHNYNTFYDGLLTTEDASCLQFDDRDRDIRPPQVFAPTSEETSAVAESKVCAASLQFNDQPQDQKPRQVFGPTDEEGSAVAETKRSAAFASPSEESKKSGAFSMLEGFDLFIDDLENKFYKGDKTCRYTNNWERRP